MAGVPISGVPLEIGLRSLGGVNRFDIRLSPEDLGGIDVRLDIDRDGRVSAHLLVDKPETLTFLQRDAGHLERALEQAGFRTQDGGISVLLRDPSGGEPWSGRGRDPQGGEQNRAAPGWAQEQDLGLQDGGGARAARRLTWSRASGIDLRI